MHLNIKIHGRVQGVFFRHFAKKKAAEFGVKGFARNEADGAVYIEAEGDKENLDKFLKCLKKGPKLARVERIDATERGLRGYNEFKIES